MSSVTRGPASSRCCSCSTAAKFAWSCVTMDAVSIPSGSTRASACRASEKGQRAWEANYQSRVPRARGRGFPSSFPSQPLPKQKGYESVTRQRYGLDQCRCRLKAAFLSPPERRLQAAAASDQPSLSHHMNRPSKVRNPPSASAQSVSEAEARSSPANKLRVLVADDHT